MNDDFELVPPEPVKGKAKKKAAKVVFDPDYEPEPGRLQVWSCGGGTQSAAIAALIVMGELPKPDLALIVDTGREKQSTWDYFDAVLKPELAKVGVELHRVSKDEFAKVDLYRNGDLLLPVFTNQSGEVGKLPAYCSNEWKRRVAQRWMRQRGVTSCDLWIGISIDEMRRVRKSDEQWCENRYVLLEKRKSRNDCERIVSNAGWPKAPRSACWMCSNMGDLEWLEMKTNRPDEFAMAVAFDYELRETDPHAFLHESCLPLDRVEFATREGGIDERGCASGFCFV